MLVADPRLQFLGLSLVLSIVGGCSSSASTPVAEDGTPIDAAPSSSRAAGRARDGRETRDEAFARFFTARGITFTSSAESRWVSLGNGGAVVLTIKNGSDQELKLIGERAVGWWPFKTSERAVAVLNTATVHATLRTGVQSSRDTLERDGAELLAEEFVIPAGGEKSLRLSLDGALPKEVECAVVTVRTVLHPLAVVVGDEPERFVALHFPEVQVSFGPSDVAAAAADDARPFERALTDRPEELTAAAFKHSEIDLVGTIDRLMAALPGPDPRARRARCVALEWLTHKSLGDSVERWRSWWESDEGLRFARH